MNPDFRDLLVTFNAHGVEFLVVGGYALAAHGHVRATKDLDVWVRPEPPNARKALQALAVFGAPLHDLTEEDLSSPGLIFQIGVPPIRIDVITAIDGVDFEDAWRERFATRFGGEPVFVLSRRHLIANKKAVGRLQDLADIEELERRKGGIDLRSGQGTSVGRQDGPEDAPEDPRLRACSAATGDTAPPPVAVDPHPLLAAELFVTEFPRPLADVPSPPWLLELLSAGAAAPFASDETVRTGVRDLLRHGGFKPTGRSKPASEYLVRAASEGRLAPINAAVDAGNAVSLHSGLPISVVDLDHAAPPLRIAIAGPGMRYVFNPTGQEIDVEGLACLFDAGGPCASAVKDAQRTKTGPETRRTLSVVWGASTLGDRARRATGWYRELLDRLGARTGPGIAGTTPA
jgi:DNA/RNA-binding domain of Phe-tRNA-synthetase-like protein